MMFIRRLSLMFWWLFLTCVAVVPAPPAPKWGFSKMFGRGSADQHSNPSPSRKSSSSNGAHRSPDEEDDDEPDPNHSPSSPTRSRARTRTVSFSDSGADVNKYNHEEIEFEEPPENIDDDEDVDVREIFAGLAVDRRTAEFNNMKHGDKHARENVLMLAAGKRGGKERKERAKSLDGASEYSAREKAAFKGGTNAEENGKEMGGEDQVVHGSNSKGNQSPPKNEVVPGTPPNKGSVKTPILNSPKSATASPKSGGASPKPANASPKSTLASPKSTPASPRSSSAISSPSPKSSPLPNIDELNPTECTGTPAVPWINVNCIKRAFEVLPKYINSIKSTSCPCRNRKSGPGDAAFDAILAQAKSDQQQEQDKQQQLLNKQNSNANAKSKSKSKGKANAASGQTASGSPLTKTSMPESPKPSKQHGISIERQTTVPMGTYLINHQRQVVILFLIPWNVFIFNTCLNAVTQFNHAKGRKWWHKTLCSEEKGESLSTGDWITWGIGKMGQYPFGPDYTALCMVHLCRTVNWCQEKPWAALWTLPSGENGPQLGEDDFHSWWVGCDVKNWNGEKRVFANFAHSLPEDFTDNKDDRIKDYSRDKHDYSRNKHDYSRNKHDYSRDTNGIPLQEPSWAQELKNALGGISVGVASNEIRVQADDKIKGAKEGETLVVLGDGLNEDEGVHQRDEFDEEVDLVLAGMGSENDGIHGSADVDLDMERETGQTGDLEEGDCVDGEADGDHVHGDDEDDYCCQDDVEVEQDAAVKDQEDGSTELLLEEQLQSESPSSQPEKSQSPPSSTSNEQQDQENPEHAPASFSSEKQVEIEQHYSSSIPLNSNDLRADNFKGPVTFAVTKLFEFSDSQPGGPVLLGKVGKICPGYPKRAILLPSGRSPMVPIASKRKAGVGSGGGGRD